MRTVLIGDVFATALCLAVMAPLWLENRRRTAGIGLWVVDYVLQFLGIMLIALRGSVPDVVSVVIANGLVIGGTIILYNGLERYVGRKGRQVQNYAMLAVFLLVQSYFTFVRPDLQARNISISLALLFICAQAAWLLLKRADASVRATARPAGLVLAAYGFASLARVAVDVFEPATNDLFRSGVLDGGAILLYEILFVALTFALYLMVNRRLVAALESDILERKRGEERLRELSDRDPLTGVLNTRAFQSAAERRLARTGASRMSLIYLDLDRLKETNDHYGHAAGDEAIVLFAKVLQEAFRESDVIGRMGGDEFAVLAISREPVTDDDLVTRYAQALQRHNDAAGLPLPVSASLGIASWDSASGTPDLQELIRTADASMYASKRRWHSALELGADIERTREEAGERDGQ